MAKYKKMSRKELKQPDEFVAATTSFLKKLEEYKRAIIIGVSLFFILFFGYFFYNEHKIKSQEKSALMFSEAIKLFDAPIMDPNEEIQDEDKELPEVSFNSNMEKFTQASAKFSDVYKKYSSYPYGKISLFYLGHSYYYLGDYEKALDYYLQFEKAFLKLKDIRNLVHDAIGHTYEAKGDIDNAISYYDKITMSDHDFLKDYSFYNLGRCYEQKQDLAKAKSFYEKGNKDFPESAIKELISKKLTAIQD
ncbi:MAG: tetratricopeptide repeat protein [Pseudomonadota bacterium]